MGDQRKTNHTSLSSWSRSVVAAAVQGGDRSVHLPLARNHRHQINCVVAGGGGGDW